MIAEVKLICSKCGKEFTMSKGVQTQEEKESWEAWAKDTYKSPYCPECSKQKAAELEVQKGVMGGFSVAVGDILKKDGE